MLFKLIHFFQRASTPLGLTLLFYYTLLVIVIADKKTSLLFVSSEPSLCSPPAGGPLWFKKMPKSHDNP